MFKQRVFASDPKLYEHLFKKQEEIDISEYEPKDMQDVQHMLSELQRTGFS